MAYYDWSKEKRNDIVMAMTATIGQAVATRNVLQIALFCADEDTYIRKNTYLILGRLFEQQQAVLDMIIHLAASEHFSVRQTAVNAAGEIGKHHFDLVQQLFDQALFDTHHAVRNAVIGSVKKMAEVNPIPVLAWAQTYLAHEDREIRRQICHGIELRGRKHPEDILPLLATLQFDTTRRVRDTLVHVLGQIAYKKGCLPIVVTALLTWENKALVADAFLEIISVHERYRNFAFLTAEAAASYIAEQSAANS